MPCVKGARLHSSGSHADLHEVRKVQVGLPKMTTPQVQEVAATATHIPFVSMGSLRAAGSVEKQCAPENQRPAYLEQRPCARRKRQRWPNTLRSGRGEAWYQQDLPSVQVIEAEVALLYRIQADLMLLNSVWPLPRSLKKHRLKD